MPTEIEKAAVSVENLCAALDAAGYETQLSGDDISVSRAGCYLSIRNYPEFYNLSIQTQMQLNEKISDIDLHELLARLNQNAFHFKTSAFRWDDVCVVLFSRTWCFTPLGSTYRISSSH